jgi:hypothetical protein
MFMPRLKITRAEFTVIEASSKSLFNPNDSRSDYNFEI